MADLALFDAARYVVEPPEPVERLSEGRRRTIRQAGAVGNGVHPLALIFGARAVPFHPLADRTARAGDHERLAYRCGSCRFRQVLPYHRRSYPKCLNPGGYSADELEKFGPPRVSHGPGTDVRAWWPACEDYSPGDGAVSEDAARYMPEVVSADG